MQQVGLVTQRILVTQPGDGWAFVSSLLTQLLSADIELDMQPLS